MTTRILLMRHGETAWNRSKVFRGLHDIPLNDTGRAQAMQLGAALATYKIHAAYTSPLSRAVETAKLALNDHDLVAQECAGLADFDYGAWTGLEERVVAQRWPHEFAVWQTAPRLAQIPGGDTLQAVYDRAFATLERISAAHAEQTVALFAHRVVNKLLVLACLTLGVERFAFVRQDNSCLNELEYTSTGYVLVRLNDTSHLRTVGLPLLVADF